MTVIWFGDMIVTDLQRNSCYKNKIDYLKTNGSYDFDTSTIEHSHPS